MSNTDSGGSTSSNNYNNNAVYNENAIPLSNSKVERLRRILLDYAPDAFRKIVRCAVRYAFQELKINAKGVDLNDIYDSMINDLQRRLVFIPDELAPMLISPRPMPTISLRVKKSRKAVNHLILNDIEATINKQNELIQFIQERSRHLTDELHEQVEVLASIWIQHSLINSQKLTCNIPLEKIKIIPITDKDLLNNINNENDNVDEANSNCIDFNEYLKFIDPTHFEDIQP
ncbi:hypothetical protein GJ496_001546 [Pomphorhynchus laevis]|nr:hypothetical protein GJ496_001546 [Pomphorhynchus laevis]